MADLQTDLPQETAAPNRPPHRLPRGITARGMDGSELTSDKPQSSAWHWVTQGHLKMGDPSPSLWSCLNDSRYSAFYIALVHSPQKETDG